MSQREPANDKLVWPHQRETSSPVSEDDFQIPWPDPDDFDEGTRPTRQRSTSQTPKTPAKRPRTPKTPTKRPRTPKAPAKQRKARRTLVAEARRDATALQIPTDFVTAVHMVADGTLDTFSVDTWTNDASEADVTFSMTTWDRVHQIWADLDAADRPRLFDIIDRYETLWLDRHGSLPESSGGSDGRLRRRTA